MNTPATKPHLSRQDWVEAGFNSLASNGPAALRVEPLARVMGTTKGSFYWHFKDLGEFHAAMIAHWEAHAITGIIDQLETELKPAARLRKLVQLASTQSRSRHKGNNLEPSIRAWSRASDMAAQAVSRVDEQRLAYLAGLLAECGVTNPDLARAIHAAVIGMADLSTRDGQANERAIGTLIDLILALR